MTGNVPVPAQFSCHSSQEMRSREKRQMMLFAAKKPRNRQGEARVAQPARASCSKFRDRCAGREADGASFFLPKYIALGFLKEKFIPEFILPTLHPSSLLCLLKSKHLGCSSEMNHRPISELPATTLLLTQQFKAAVFADCSTKGWHHLNIQVCTEKNSFYIFCVAAAEFADIGTQGQDRSRSYRWYSQLWMLNKEKQWLLSKNGEREQDTSGDTRKEKCLSI